MKQFLETAKIVGLHGLRGEVRCQYYSDSAEFLCEVAEECGLYTDKAGKNHLDVLHARPHKNIVIIQFDGIDSPEAAQRFVGTTLYLDRNDVELDEGVYFIQDIVGLTVIDADSGEEYGKITDVYQNGATDVYSIRKSGGRELMFPHIPEVVLNIDLENGKMTIRPLPGLFDDLDDEGNEEKPNKDED